MDDHPEQRRDVSLRGSTYRRLKETAEEAGLSPREYLDRIIHHALDRDEAHAASESGVRIVAPRPPPRKDW